MLPELLLSLNSNSTANVQRGFLLNNLESGRVSASLIAELLKENMSIEEQGTLVAEIDAQLKEVETKFSNTKARWSAMLAFAHSSASRLKQDIMLLSTLGSVFVVGLLVYCFRSPLCLFFCALSVFSGILCGTFMVVFFTGGIHLITLGIGISLMGACIDYSLHFLSECFFSSTPGTKVCALSARNKVCRPILLGALTSVLAFLALKLSSFPGLQELALFALGSIIASSTTVLVWLPLLVRGKCIAPPRIFNKAQCGLLTLGKYVRTIPFPVLAIVMVLFSSTLFLLTTNDDIRALQTPDKQLIDNEIWIQNSGGFPNPSGYLIAGDSDKQKLLETLYYAHYRLEELKESEIIGGFQSVYGLVPPRKIQLDNQQAYQKFVNDNKSALNSAFVALGYPEYMQEKVYQPTPATPLDLDMLLSLLPGKSLGLSRHLSDNETGIYYSGAIPVFDLHNLQALEQAIESMPGLKFFKPADDISSQFISYRSESCLLVGISYLLILAFLYFRYGKSGLVRSAIALVGSILGTFVVLALVGQSISFFSVLAVILVLGLGVDFSIFALEDIGKDPKGDSSAVSIAILLAAASTVVSFGLLAMSSTAVLHSIGIIVSVGVLLCVVICLSIWR